PSQDAPDQVGQFLGVEPLPAGDEVLHGPPPVRVDRGPLDRVEALGTHRPRRHPQDKEVLLLAVPATVEPKLRRLPPHPPPPTPAGPPTSRAPAAHPGGAPAAGASPSAGPPPTVNQ